MHRLQNLEHGLGGRDFLGLQVGLELRVDNLAVVDDHAVAVGTLTLDPGVLAGELGAIVGGEDLYRMTR